MATKQPMYQQIADDLRKQIENGVLARGSQLDTELELRDKYEASRNTIRDAIKRLISDGLVETRPGQGTFVTARIDPFVTRITTDPRSGFGGGEGAAFLSEVADGEREPKATTPKVEVLEAPRVIAIRLRIPQGSQLVSRHQERYINNIPWSLQTSYYLMDFITKGATKLLMAQDIEEGAVRYLAEAIGVRQIGYRDWITGRRANEHEQNFFGIGHDATVFAVSRIAFDQNKTPMRLTVTISPADRNQFIVDVGDDLPDPQYEEIPGHGS